MRLNSIALRLLSLCCIAGPFIAKAQAPVLRIDINTPARKYAEVNERDYLPWVIKPGEKDSLMVDGVKFKFTKIGGGDGFLAAYYKTTMQAPYYARLISDGLYVKSGAIELRISGLPAGPHTLLTYHNEIEGTD